MFRKISALLTATAITATLSACSGKTLSDKNKPNGKINVVCTIYPQYDWVKQIAGDAADNMNITLLLDNGTDLHRYQPSADDIVTISQSDLFIYTGGTSDTWVKDVVKNSASKKLKTVDMLRVIGDKAKEEELIDGMEPEKEDKDESASSGPEYDEHVWLSLRNAKEICTQITESLTEIDSKDAETFKSNSEKYIAELDELDKQYSDTVKSAKRDTLLFADRFPFRYLAEDYKLTYYAAFPGCSAETEASFKTIVFLAGKIDELKLPSVLTVDGSNGSIAKSVISNTKDKNQKVLKLNSIQSINKDDISGGVTYLSIMRDNLKVLKEALN